MVIPPYPKLNEFSMANAVSCMASAIHTTPLPAEIKSMGEQSLSTLATSYMICFQPYGLPHFTTHTGEEQCMQPK